MTMFGRLFGSGRKTDKTDTKFILAGSSGAQTPEPQRLASLHTRLHTGTREHKALLVKTLSAAPARLNVVLASRWHTGTREHKALLASHMTARAPRVNLVLAQALQSGSAENPGDASALQAPESLERGQAWQ
jgi:hypothetical protein